MYKKHILFIGLMILGFLGCTDTPVKEEEQNKQEQPKTKETPTIKTPEFEAMLKRQVSSLLKIDATEKFDIKITYEYIDRDTLLDAVILVNRKEYAFKKSSQSENKGFFEKMGHTGPYNYIFVYLGTNKELIDTHPVGSNVHFPLSVHFESVSNPSQKDFYVEYRIKNSKYRNYYTVKNNNLHLIFNCPVFDNIGDKSPIAYHIEHKESSVRIGKDIVLYHAKIKGYDSKTIEDVNAYVPSEIIPTDDIFVYFIYDEKDMKYKTPMNK